ncbi:MAG: PASTA domain-containing protein [Actinomycetota bacterium]
MSGPDLDQTAARTLGDRYLLLSRIGSGASADVYQASDLKLGRDVAVKQLRAELTDDDRFLKLFRSEAHLAAQLSHPNILTVFDWSEDPDGADGGAYIVTEMLSGGTLRHILNAAGPLDPAQAAVIGLQAARGLAFAHEQGLVHRDIKPANLLFGVDGRVYIGDFGIARAVARAAWTEPEGVLIGTARYAAPEQATPGGIDGLVDVYSLAVCLIEAMTGEVPLVKENALSTMVLRQSTDLPVDGSFGPLAEPLARAGRADAAERSTAVEFRDALLEVCREMPDPDPLTLIDLTEQGDGPRIRHRPNVRINDDGELIIEDDDGPDLALPPDQPMVGALNDQTSDGYETVQHGRQPIRWGRWALLAVLCFLLGAGALLAGRAIADSRAAELETIELGLPSYPVPDFTGASPAEAIAAVAEFDWTITVSEEQRDGTEAGELLTQSPAPGSRLGPGGEVTLLYSLGPVPRTVPEMIGRPEADVRDVVERSGLEIGTVGEQFSETVDAGLVIEATIDGVPAQPGTEFPPGVVIDLVLSSGPAPREVPSIDGLTVEQARATVEDRDLVLATAEAYSETVAEGLIISADPPGGQNLSRGGTVTATVSLGRPFVTVPDLIGVPVSEAIDELRAQGFEVAINGTIGSSVIALRPVPGESVRSGTEIEIISSN